MKTPDETKRGIITCMELNMEHFMPGATQKALADALALIQKLEAQNAEKDARIKQLEAERDAAVKDMTEIVQNSGEPCCDYCGADFKPKCTGHCWTHNEGFKWLGVQKEDPDA